MRFIFSFFSTVHVFCMLFDREKNFTGFFFCSYSLNFRFLSTLPNFFFFIQWHFLYDQINGWTTFNDKGKLQMLRIKRKKNWPKVTATITKMACLLSIWKKISSTKASIFLYVWHCVCAKRKYFKDVDDKKIT